MVVKACEPAKRVGRATLQIGISSHFRACLIELAKPVRKPRGVQVKPRVLWVLAEQPANSIERYRVGSCGIGLRSKELFIHIERVIDEVLRSAIRIRRSIRA